MELKKRKDSHRIFSKSRDDQHPKTSLQQLKLDYKIPVCGMLIMWSALIGADEDSTALLGI